MTSTREILPPAATIAVDAMGGDHAPGAIVAGVAQAARLHPTVEFELFGHADQLSPLIKSHPKVADRMRINACEVVLPAGEKPSRAARKAYEQSSLACAIRATAEGRAGACVSAADTGAMMALGIKHLGLLNGIDRPAVAS